MTSVKEISIGSTYSVNINSKITISARVDITEKQPTEKLECISSNPEIASVESSSGTWQQVND